MTQFISLVEQGDNSVHFVNLQHLVQVVHVPNSPVATVTTADGKSFRISEAEYAKFSGMMTGAQKQ